MFNCATVVDTTIQCPPVRVGSINGNGSITYAPDSKPNYDVNTTATYACSPGYLLIGSKTRICVINNMGEGTWNNEAPMCVRKYIINVIRYLFTRAICSY